MHRRASAMIFPIQGFALYPKGSESVFQKKLIQGELQAKETTTILGA